jgi:UDP-3-O-acyl-N-acetylglucosamine deacetylase
MLPSRQITRPINHISGVGLFSGRPASFAIGPGDRSGTIKFEGYGHVNPFSPASVRRVTYDTSWSGLPSAVPIRNTTLNASGWREPPPEPPIHAIATVEHLLAALAGLGVFEAYIHIESDKSAEVPILDGSAKPWVDALLPVLADGPALDPITLTHPIEVQGGDASISATPAASISYTYNLDYGPASPLKPHSATWRGDPTDFIQNISPARTFSLRSEAQAAQKAGLFKHLTPKDMLVIGDNGQPIDNAWRMEGEPARHKLLDLIGDLALLGRPLLANVVATRSGHRLTHEFCRQILDATAP